MLKTGPGRPIPGLDQREATYWLPNASVRRPRGALLIAFTWILIISGWIAAIVVAAGLSRVSVGDESWLLSAKRPGGSFQSPESMVTVPVPGS